MQACLKASSFAEELPHVSLPQGLSHFETLGIAARDCLRTPAAPTCATDREGLSQSCTPSSKKVKPSISKCSTAKPYGPEVLNRIEAFVKTFKAYVKPESSTLSTESLDESRMEAG